MDESTNSAAQVEETEQAQPTEEKHETDWKAEARKWEKRAKENKDAADELAQLKESQMTELEKAHAAADQAKAEAEALKAEKAKSDAAIKINASTGIPTEILMYCADPDEIEAFAKALQEWTDKDGSPAHVGSTTGKSRIVRPGAKLTNADVFAQLLGDM